MTNESYQTIYYADIVWPAGWHSDGADQMRGPCPAQTHKGDRSGDACALVTSRTAWRGQNVIRPSFARLPRYWQDLALGSEDLVIRVVCTRTAKPASSHASPSMRIPTASPDVSTVRTSARPVGAETVPRPARTNMCGGPVARPDVPPGVDRGRRARRYCGRLD